MDIILELVLYFDEIVILGVFGCGKFDLFIFDYVLLFMDLKKDEVIMVGDNLMIDILGFFCVGMKFVWINCYDKEWNEVIFIYEIIYLSELYLILDELNL